MRRFISQPVHDRHNLSRPLARWQSARTWARLIREAESLWRVNVRELQHLGALELGQLHLETPQALRPEVNRWLFRFGALTRLAHHR
ncbi:MAG: hypothetical protein ERJ67_06165 [Aphanocapsa feldmannii 277cV]|uniref:Uncharacterized protein n=1 Tax=Aphanocapsa feldmannii 277cV TaxID=2507553 RepID=A0A524RN79_9CHRO|nr:MAG: hypothetical protein ERJ69_08740 [Aphanocapsa feldmannii 288cV]TGG92240.1 MAG: hypothetical protein ERJ67_06165 [Aphanocapsa feldmannii 277cV]